MKTKQLILLLVAAVILASIGIFVNHVKDKSWTSDRSGDNLCPDFNPQNIAAATFQNTAGETTLTEKGNSWVVEERDGYPANFQKLKSLVFNISDETILRDLDVSKSNYDRLEVGSPEGNGSGTKLTLKDAEGETLTQIVFGKTHQKSSGGSPRAQYGSSGSGRYVRVEDTVAMVDNSYKDISADPTDWLNEYFVETKDLVNAQLKEDGETKWVLQRPDTDADWTLKGFEAEGEEKLDTSAASDINNAFKYSDFEDVADQDAPAEKTGLDSPKVFTAVDKQDIKYTFNIGNQTDNDSYYMTVEAAYIGPEEAPSDKQGNNNKQKQQKKKKSSQKGKAKKKDEKSFQEKLKERKSKVEKVNNRLSDWTYLVKNSTVEDVVKDRSDFITTEEEEKEKTQKQRTPKNLKKMMKSGGKKAPKAPVPPKSK